MGYFYGLLLVLSVISGRFILYKVPVLKHSRNVSVFSKEVSIIIPARNEAKNLPHLLETLKNQTVTSIEIIVADDYSEDDTVKVAESYGAKIVQVSEEEIGWVGKSAGCFAGAKIATGDWLFFMDADTFLPQNNSLENILRAFNEQKAEGILSIQPYHMIQRPYENLSTVFNILVLAGMNRFSYLQNKLEPGGAFGPSILCTKEAYFDIGGHARVQEAIMENIALGEMFLANQQPVFLYGGKGSLHFRMYPEGVVSLGKGWGKSFATGSATTHPLVLGASILWITGAFFSFGYLLSALLIGSMPQVMLGMVGYTLYFIQFEKMARKAGNFDWYALFLFPFLFLYFAGVYAYSAIRTFVFGTVSWKGREREV